MIKKVKITMTPDELAEMFIFWDNHKQAKFINLIGQHFKSADFPAELQCCYISQHITKLGRDFIYTLANFLRVQKFTDKSPHYDRLINTYDHDSLN
jgi:hypothetical protein